MSAAAFFALRFGLFQKVLNQSVQEAGIVGTDGNVDFRQVRPDVVMAAIHNRHAKGQTVLRRYANAAAHALEQRRVSRRRNRHAVNDRAVGLEASPMHEGNRLMEEFRFGLVARRQPRKVFVRKVHGEVRRDCLLYTSPSPRD